MPKKQQTRGGAGDKSEGYNNNINKSDRTLEDKKESKKGAEEEEENLVRTEEEEETQFSESQ